MHPLETYLTEIREIHSTGGPVPEKSYYGALERLLNEVGRKLKPRVRCVPQVADTGAGSPDFGLYTSDQFQKTRDMHPLPGQLPERGVIEVKPPSRRFLAHSQPQAGHQILGTLPPGPRHELS